MLYNPSQCRALGQNMVIVDIEKAKELEDIGRDYDRFTQDDDMKFDVIDQIHNYILEHLSGDVSLTAIAEEVHFNPSYLSRYYADRSQPARVYPGEKLEERFI